MSSIIPAGFKPTLSKYASPFDKEVLADDDKELWLIRIPDNLDEEDLANVRMKAPSHKASKKALAKLEKDNDKFALYKVPTEQDMDEETEGESLDLGISGHEMVAFDCLVPSREENGKLVFAPKKFDQYLILNQIVDIPDSTAYAQSILDTPVYKRDQPEGLKMRFMPYGYYSGQVVTEEEDVEIKETPIEKDESSKRKRTTDEDTTEVEKKKSKKEKKEKKKDKKVKKEKA